MNIMRLRLRLQTSVPTRYLPTLSQRTRHYITTSDRSLISPVVDYPSAMADAESILRDLLETIVKDLDCDQHDIEIKPITSGGANYTSALFLATINTPKEKLDLFAKVAIIGEKMREMVKTVRLYETEGFVYNSLMKNYIGLQEKHNVAGKDLFVFPKFYGSNPEVYKETIVLENLMVKGYKTYDRFKSIDWEYAASAIETLAKFHALSFAYRKQHPEEFHTVAEDFKFKRTEQGDEMKAVWRKMIDRGISVVTKERGDRISKYFGDGDDHMELYEKFNLPMGTPVLIHGDYRPSNLLYRKQDDEVHVIPVDYQTLRSGCPVTDLVYFIFTGSDARFRAEHYERLVEHYFQQLSLALERLGMDPSKEYPRVQFDSDLKEMLPFALIIGLAILPIVTVEAAEAPRLDGDATISSFVIPSNDLFAERFSDIIEDLVRWEII